VYPNIGQDEAGLKRLFTQLMSDNYSSPVTTMKTPHAALAGDN
jgi:hypothetical protein